MTTPPLSPAAQAVLDATDEWASYDIPTGLIAAATIRALVEQVTRRDRTDMPYITPADILDIAAELDGAAPQPTPTETPND